MNVVCHIKGITILACRFTLLINVNSSVVDARFEICVSVFLLLFSILLKFGLAKSIMLIDLYCCAGMVVVVWKTLRSF